jgi:hypothetical protein
VFGGGGWGVGGMRLPIKHDRRDTTIDPTESKKTIREYHRQLYGNTLKSIEEMHKFLKR